MNEELILLASAPLPRPQTPKPSNAMPERIPIIVAAFTEYAMTTYGLFFTILSSAFGGLLAQAKATGVDFFSPDPVNGGVALFAVIIGSGIGAAVSTSFHDSKMRNPTRWLRRVLVSMGLSFVLTIFLVVMGAGTEIGIGPMKAHIVANVPTLLFVSMVLALFSKEVYRWMQKRAGRLDEDDERLIIKPGEEPKKTNQP